MCFTECMNVPDRSQFTADFFSAPQFLEHELMYSLKHKVMCSSEARLLCEWAWRQFMERNLSLQYWKKSSEKLEVGTVAIALGGCLGFALLPANTFFCCSLHRSWGVGAFLLGSAELHLAQVAGGCCGLQFGYLYEMSVLFSACFLRQPYSWQ